MPTPMVVKLLERVAVVEVKVAELMKYQRWQMGLLTAILVAVGTAWATR